MATVLQQHYGLGPPPSFFSSISLFPIRHSFDIWYVSWSSSLPWKKMPSWGIACKPTRLWGPLETNASLIERPCQTFRNIAATIAHYSFFNILFCLRLNLQYCHSLAHSFELIATILSPSDQFHLICQSRGQDPVCSLLLPTFLCRILCYQSSGAGEIKELS